MKKIILLIFISASMVLGSTLNPLASTTNTQTQNIEQKKYSEILNYLEMQGDGESLFYLASFYLNGSPTPDSEGKIVKKNTELAIKYLKKSSELNFPYASITLGSLYLYHEDFIIRDNNIEKAEEYLTKAINEEVYEAYTILADIYFNYKGDAKKAVELLSEGAAKNISTAQYALAVIYNRGLTSEDFTLEKNDLISSKYLTDACLNNKKTKKIKELCYNSNLITKEKAGE